MSARPQPKRVPEEQPVLLPMPEKPASPRRGPSAGYVQVPKHATFSADLKPSDKVVLEGLLAFCYGKQTWTCATKREIAAAVSLHPGSVKRSLARLTRFGFIARRPDPESVGHRWVTHILCHWRTVRNSEQPSVQTNLNKHPPGGTICAPPGVSKVPPLGYQKYPPRSNPIYNPNIVVEFASEPDPTNDDDASSSTQESKTADPGGLIALARAAWPHEPDLDHRVAELVELAGAAKAALAVEYAVLRRVKRLGYTFVLLRSWSNLTPVECAERVEAERAKAPRTPPGRPAAQPVMQNLNTPAPIEPDPDPAATAAVLTGGWRSWGAAP